VLLFDVAFILLKEDLNIPNNLAQPSNQFRSKSLESCTEMKVRSLLNCHIALSGERPLYANNLSIYLI
jgi:hypothetical protein